ncbi:hypothetical protein AWM68_08995 [Fictibacillus phosphorivorans]|uniref:Uncharacterized protein n=1 Tax=Fictibacillus phosphorivorans TaxID=1221500 RepID=A0A163QA01_9BACL|nr:hypothetical protein [Fictibacillus phosphorivorans]KZE64790.1 hypothetical protein AWM68_08995 [Fictibacillus phosphorivorans]
MIWLYLFAPIGAVLFIAAFVHWRTKQRYKRYNLNYEAEQNLSENNKINNAAAWNASQQNHHSGGSGGL